MLSSRVLALSSGATGPQTGLPARSRASRVVPFASHHAQQRRCSSTACGASSSSGAVANAARLPSSCWTRRRPAARCAATVPEAEDAPRVAVEGDLVTIHFSAKTAEGEVVESTRAEGGEPLTFEIGSGEIMGNPIFKAFDGAVRGLAPGQSVEIEISGGDWRPELLFVVPRDHPEVERLEGRYKNVGGLAEGLVVELSNGRPAVVLEVKEAEVKLDANNMGAGKSLLFDLEVVDVQRAE